MRPRVVVISIDGFAAFYPQARLPHLRRLAERGALASGMETVFPSTTWPTHVSMVTGVSPKTHGVVANHILNRQTRAAEDLTGDPIYDAPALLRAPTVYDLAHGAGLRTAAVDWPATRNATTLDFNLPFFKDQRVFETQTARAVWEELSALGYPMHRQGDLSLPFNHPGCSRGLEGRWAVGGRAHRPSPNEDTDPEQNVAKDRGSEHRAGEREETPWPGGKPPRR